MKRKGWLVVIVATLILVSFSLANAQPWRGKGQWGPWSGNCLSWNWNQTTIETVKGKVVSKDTITSRGRKGFLTVGMTLKMEDGNDIYIHLGPQWYFDKQDLSIKVGDVVEVTGSKTPVSSNIVLLASSVKKGDKTWQFRDQQGFPFWSGRRW